MIACLDVYYCDNAAVAAAIVFPDWISRSPLSEYTTTVTGVAEYEAGRFYLRELVPLKAVIAKIAEPIEVYVIDAYCYLSSDRAHGLGAYLYESLGRSTPIIGVAKNRYRDTNHAVELLRGGSVRPFYVTSIGLDYHLAARHINGRQVSNPGFDQSRGSFVAEDRTRQWIGKPRSRHRTLRTSITRTSPPPSRPSP
jgi:deoxyribonuclease V